MDTWTGVRFHRPEPDEKKLAAINGAQQYRDSGNRQRLESGWNASQGRSTFLTNFEDDQELKDVIQDRDDEVEVTIRTHMAAQKPAEGILNQVQQEIKDKDWIETR